MNLRPEEISSIIKQQIKNYDNKIEMTNVAWLSCGILVLLIRTRFVPEK